MMISELILFLTSIFPVLIIGLYVYKKDRNKEPKTLIIKLFFGGIGSCFLVLILTTLLSRFFPMFSLEPSDMNLLQLFIYSFLCVALLEEFCKWIMVYGISYNNENFDEFYDIIIYSVFVALGFACFENLFYVYENGVGVGILRALLSVPGHSCDGVIMGYYLGLAKIKSLRNKKNLKLKYFLSSILMPTLLHGFFDFCLFTQMVVFVIVFFIFVVIIYIYVLKKIKKISSINTKMKYQDSYCSICGKVVDSDYCPNCGRKNE